MTFRKTYEDFEKIFKEKGTELEARFTEIATPEGIVTLEQCIELVNDVSIMISFDCEGAKTFFKKDNP